ncbi:hypothetical protein M409DRAFT_20855 [Zasmidium cellare ATCC 36951]|uniref:Uncharacterized protein n=1 Tax=Zasmidium cellare ATCC 36951 TaxID=1080233 RepID=A0A6A6CRS2_ZASCE|nr:uncharacterized protein M409DRAFT_20855 [Zasmidium cellare ATCC 36951]KAF2168840.1 hypothetical protein M409DRAFT_20855 [Zasmidium cellare ATCC 36951]
MSSSSRPSSAANPPSGEGVSMSYYNDAASELGRKLTLGDRGTPSDDMKTRSQAKKESQSKGKSSSSSRAHASSSSKSAGKGKAKAPAEPTRRQPRRDSTRRARDPSPDDDDDDDEEDENDDESDDGNDPPPSPPPPQTPSMSVQERNRRVVFAILSVNDPNRGSLDPSLHLSPWEFIDANTETQLNAKSRHHLALANVVLSLVRTQDDLTRLMQATPLNGTFWGETVVADLRHRAETALRLFKGHLTPQRDALDTLREFRRIFKSVDKILREWPLASMHRDSKVALVHLLTHIFNTILLTHEDVSRVGQSAPVYAGSTDAYNLFGRFKSSRNDWPPCLETLRMLIQLDSTLFNQSARASLIHSCQLLDWHHSQGRIKNQSAEDFMKLFKWSVQSLPAGE